MSVKFVKCIYPYTQFGTQPCKYMRVDCTCDYEQWRIDNYSRLVNSCAWMGGAPENVIVDSDLSDGLEDGLERGINNLFEHRKIEVNGRTIYVDVAKEGD